MTMGKESEGKPYLTMPQLLSQLGKTEDEVLALAVVNGLPLRTHKSIFYNGARGASWGYGIVPVESLEFLHVHRKVTVGYLLEDDGSKFYPPPPPLLTCLVENYSGASTPSASTPQPTAIKACQLVAMKADVEKFKADHPEMFNPGNNQVPYQRARKISISELKEIAKGLSLSESNYKVIAAVLRDEYHAAYWRIAEALEMKTKRMDESKLKNPSKKTPEERDRAAKEKAAENAVKAGRKILKEQALAK